ncbi:MAG: metallophosphoesterase [Arenicellales bacterium]
MNRLKTIFLWVLLAIIAFVVFGYFSVYRYPRLTLDPSPKAQQLTLASGTQLAFKGAYLKRKGLADFRAFTPDVQLQIHSGEQSDSEIVLQIENIHPQATLHIEGDSAQIQESSEGLLRKVSLKNIPPKTKVNLTWRFPEKPSYRFAAIGDTGGNKELSWGLIRAQQLGADFVLHLGDAYYDSDEIGQVGARMNQSSIPVYTANGNHDFRGPDGNSIQTFLQNVSPLNARFSLLGHCFLNVDTGAYMFPPNKGGRATLLAAEIKAQAQNPQACKDYIVFTHKPILSDFIAEFPQREHSLHGYDAKPLIKQLQALKNVTIIAGHIHQDFEFKQDGLRTIVTGSGLAQADLMEGEYRAQILLGDIVADAFVKTQWARNKMPMAYHCSKKVARSILEDAPEKAGVLEQVCLEN